MRSSGRLYPRPLTTAALVVAAMICCLLANAQEVTVTARAAVAGSGKKAKAQDASNAVIWLMPAEGTVLPAWSASSIPRPRLVQKNKSFSPHVLVVHVGSQVDFPNRDPFFHNVFSLFEGKRFDLGLYEAGSTRQVQFDKQGVSYIFCNIHAEMSAVVIAVNTPYFAVSNSRGELVIPNVLPGRYLLHMWNDGVQQDALNALTRSITVSEASSTLGLLRLPASPPLPPHKNMYGKDYTPPAPGSPAYEHP
jgi:plastocyanin